MMNRGLLILLIIIAALVYLGIKAKGVSRSLSTTLFAAAGSLFLLALAGFFGWVGG